MKKLLLTLFLSMCVLNAQIDIMLEDEIHFRTPSGTLNATIFIDNQQVQAIGTYKLNKDNKKVLFVIDRLSKNGRLFNIKQQPSITRELKNVNAKMPKGTKLTLKGENPREFAEFAKILQNDDKGESNNKAAKKAQTSGGSQSTQGSSGSSVGNISVGGQSSAGQIPYLPITSTTTNEDGSTTESKWSAQYCKVPEFLDNAIKLSIVDKNGNCVEKMAVRDDTKCEYRYDFANSKAIKQTQFYYVDNENKVQTVGDCVDLVGKEYQAELYKDDSRCDIEDNDRGDFFVTQILFRGIDGLIHEATDCIAYGNIKEEVVEYDKDDNKKEARRIVNQYYIDPFTNEQVYITKGVKTDVVFNYVEKACGDWQMDDTLLQGKKRTEITFYDSIDYKEIPVTSCDFSVAGGKQSEYIVKYQDLSSTYKEQELSREKKEIKIDKKKLTRWTHTYDPCSIFSCDKKVTHYGQEHLGTIKWTTTYVLKDVTSYKVYLRPDGTEYKQNQSPSGETFKKIFREVLREQDDFQLNDKDLEYYELNEGFYEDNDTKLSKEFNEWIAKKYKKEYVCQNYSIHNPSNGEGSYTCTKWLHYILP